MPPNRAVQASSHPAHPAFLLDRLRQIWADVDVRSTAVRMAIAIAVDQLMSAVAAMFIRGYASVINYRFEQGCPDSWRRLHRLGQ